MEGSPSTVTAVFCPGWWLGGVPHPCVVPVTSTSCRRSWSHLWGRILCCAQAQTRMSKQDVTARCHSMMSLSVASPALHRALPSSFHPTAHPQLLTSDKGVPCVFCVPASLILSPCWVAQAPARPGTEVLNWTTVTCRDQGLGAGPCLLLVLLSSAKPVSSTIPPSLGVVVRQPRP